MFIIYEARDLVAVVRLNRPEKLNALTGEMLAELHEVFDRIEQEGYVRAVILTGAGERAFSAGTDISELQHQDREGAAFVSLRGQDACERIERCNVPVIAAVNGL